MPRLTRRRASWLAAALAAAVYLLALRNGWSGDDLVAVLDNPTAHSVAAGLRGWFAPYWPGAWQWAGLYRPLTILSYAVDWSLSGGAPWWFHLVNVLLNALAGGLVVLVMSRWLPPLGSLVAGIVFAVHPAHVEAVANVVGRAELLVAVGLLLALLAARRYRAATTARARRGWMIATLAAVFVALASKEHGVIAIALLVLDRLLDPEPPATDSTPLFAAVIAMTAAWLFLWRGIAGGYVGTGRHAAFFGLSWGGRLATMLPLYLEVLRTLAWPFRLLSDYAPQTAPVHTSLTLLGVLGLAAALSVVALGGLSVRRAPVVAFGIFAALLSYAPTSNLVFVSGVMLAERNLYLAVLAPAAVAGWGITALRGRPQFRAASLALGALLAACAVRAVDRIPFWADPFTPIAEEQAAHPENFHTRVVLAQYLAPRGDSAWALGELLVAADLFPRDPLARVLASQLALEMGRRRLALKQAEDAYAIYRGDPRVIDALVRALLANGEPDSAAAVAAAGSIALAGSAAVLGAYDTALAAVGGQGGRRALVRLRLDWLDGRFAEAQKTADSLAGVIAEGARPELTCADVEAVGPVLQGLAPGLWTVLENEARCESTTGS